MNVLINGDVRRHSTQAARAYVLATRQRMQVELDRNGEKVRTTRNFQQLEHSITAGELVRTWSHADLDEVLAE
jgi:hypothetical protein